MRTALLKPIVTSVKKYIRQLGLFLGVCVILLTNVLSTAIADENKAASSAKPKPLFAVRELYATGHFGNSYEVMGDNEYRSMLENAAAWGFNGVSDWFDMDDCQDPFTPGHSFGLGETQWIAKKQHFALAQKLGINPVMTVNPNHVYISQCLPELKATRGYHILGQLICPSIPEARKIILKNYDNLFSDLAKSGVRLTALNACPYDYGGCRCEKCNPWILTYAQLMREIHGIAQKYHPGLKMNMLGWWWSPEEHQLFAEWVDRNAPGWIDVMYLWFPYGQTKVPDVPLPKGSRRGAWIHIGYAEQAAPRDMYGHLGPVIAAQRMQETVRDLKEQGVVGYCAYSEGLLDDVNKAILGGLSSGEYQTADEALEAYARRYFGVNAPTAKRWAAWLKAWGKPFNVNVAQAREELQSLLKETPEGGWRLRQWELKLDLFAAHQAVGKGDKWTPERLAAADRFWAVREQIHRGLWGLPPQRHALGIIYTPVPWYKSWAKFKSQQAETLGKEQ
jgi:hypothetical protein